MDSLFTDTSTEALIRWSTMPQKDALIVDTGGWSGGTVCVCVEVVVCASLPHDVENG